MSLTSTDPLYLSKLRTGQRPAALTSTIVILTTHTQTRHYKRAPEWSSYLQPYTLGVARQLLPWVAQNTGLKVTPGLDVAVGRLLANAIALYAARAVAEMGGLDDPSYLEKRLDLIVVTEVQRESLELSESGVNSSGAVLVIRELSQRSRSCDECVRLAGVYRKPFPPDLYYSHPRCACLVRKLA